jgi:hypothetical protein
VECNFFNIDDYDNGALGWQLFLGQAITLKLGKKWYSVRLISIDINNKKARFSQYVSDNKPDY